MKLISEKVIDDLVEYYESFPETLVNKTTTYMEDYPTLLGYLQQESNDVLLDEEKDLQWYLVVVSLSAILEVGIEIPEFTVETLSEAEEYNWDILQEQKSGIWKERLNPFFQSFKQEDLLAFIEDMIEEDEESPITSIGKEVIFITVKSVLDCIFAK